MMFGEESESSVMFWEESESSVFVLGSEFACVRRT
jgi:hypothetical protein